ncbi:MAG TPA: POTRA domain-containing protein, partial [Chitinophagaceae bacterium]|nr:POTRA domain-containing protein [Chitinophagaceae bacterium]
MHSVKIYLFLLTLSAIFCKVSGQQLHSELPSSASAGTFEAKTSDQPPAPFVIRNIVITGNKKTRGSIILREIPFKPGDHFALQDLVAKFEDARRQLMNTTLFHEVTVALKGFEGHNVDVLVDVKERWYLFPLPYFKMVDRNLNQWLVQHRASLARVNYGVKLIYNNVTGYNDKLNVWLMSGYTQQISMNYDRVYFDKQMKWGMRVGVALGKNREVNYNTINNKEVFLKDTNNFIRTFFKTNLELTYRRAIKTRHRFGIGYT